ncbi:unnamed protein product [Arabidopsis lyrata]|nr:unnamed protein product [Arabidopsis lyrata]
MSTCASPRVHLHRLWLVTCFRTFNSRVRSSIGPSRFSTVPDRSSTGLVPSSTGPYRSSTGPARSSTGPPRSSTVHLALPPNR